MNVIISMCKQSKYSIATFSAVFILAVCFSFIFYASYIYPIAGDDYGYLCIWGTDRQISSLPEFVLSVRGFYQHFIIGRISAIALTQAFLLADKWVFAAFNVIVYAATTFLIARLVRPFRLWNWVVVALMFWLLIPMPGVTIFLVDGSCNYLWAVFAVFLFLNLLLAESLKYRLWAIPLALFAGNSHEGLSCGVLVALALFAIFNWKTLHKTTYVCSFIFLVAGFLLNVLSGGNMNRMGVTQDVGFVESLTQLTYKMLSASFHLMQGLTRHFGDIHICAIILIFAIVGNYLFYKKNRTWQSLAFSFTAGALVSFAAVLVSGNTYSRVFFGCYVLSFAALYILLIPWLRGKNENIIFAFRTIIVVGCLCASVDAFLSIERFVERERYIRSQIEQGREIICIPKEFSMVHGARYAELFGLFGDMTMNRPAMRYYGAKSNFAIFTEKSLIDIVSNDSNFDCFTKEPDGVHVVGEQVIFRLKGTPKTIKGVRECVQEESAWVKCIKSALTRSMGTKPLPLSYCCLPRQGSYYVIFPFAYGESVFDITYCDGTKETRTVGESMTE